MPRKRKVDQLCVQVHLCLSNEMSDMIERYQAELRIKKGLKLRKSEAAEKLFEKLAEEKGLIE
jgi:hypothetical protein